MRKVCWHNWAVSPAGDTCSPDGSNCVMAEDFQSVVCWHTGFRRPCQQPNKCRVDGTHCIILNNSERVVCHHENFTDFGRPSDPNCNCTSVDGSNVKIVSKAGAAVPPPANVVLTGAPIIFGDMTKVCWHNWAGSPAGDACGADGTDCIWAKSTEEVVAWNSKPPFSGRLDNNTHVDGRVDGVNVFVKEKTQTIEFLPGKSINNYHDGGDPFREVCKLVNRPFPNGVLTPKDWAQTAVLIMDMWNTHPSQGTASRVDELAPQINNFVTAARNAGALIIHSPSTGSPSDMRGTIKGRYDPTVTTNGSTVEERQARQNAINARFPSGAPAGIWARNGYYYIGLPGDRSDPVGRLIEEDFDFIVNNTDPKHGIDSPAGRMRGIVSGGTPFRQNAKIIIHSTDAVSADGVAGDNNGNSYEEVLALTSNRPNIIYVGGQTNWCILRRMNGMRKMYKSGKSLAIVRDLTDAWISPGVTGVTDWACSYDNFKVPTRNYDQFTGTELVVDWIGRNLNARNDTSDTYFPAGTFKRFWFADDPRNPSYKPEGNTIAYFRLNQQGAFSAIACILYEGKLVEPKARNMFTGHLYDIMPADAIPDGAKLQFAFGTVEGNMHIMNETWVLDRRAGYVAEYGSWGTAADGECHLNAREPLP